MALVMHWYDVVCFAIVAGAILGSLWVVSKQEGAERQGDEAEYERLLVNGIAENKSLGLTRSGHLSSTQLWMSCWRGVHPGWLLATRLLSAFIMAGILAWDIRCYDASIFIYYTEWTFSLIIAHFVLGTVISIRGCQIYASIQNENGERLMDTDVEDPKHTFRTVITSTFRAAIRLELTQEEFQERAGFWEYLMHIIYQICGGAVMLTDIIFWCLIVPFLSIQHFSLNLLMGCMHSLNAVFLLIDTALNSMPFPGFRMAYFVLWSCFYVIFQWILHACGYTLWPYPFLELSTPWAPLWYFCLSLVHIPCYGIYMFVVKAKNSIFSRLFPRAYVRSS